MKKNSSEEDVTEED